MSFTQKNFHKKLLGNAGEKIARRYLENLGYKIKDSNFKTHVGEIDIIALDNDTIVFVEVKTRSSVDFGYGAEAVDRHKINKYGIVASEYLKYNNIFDKDCRFDVVEIVDGKINHIKDAFSV